MPEVQILTHVRKHIVLDAGEADHFLSLLKPRTLRKKDVLLRTGEPCTQFNYINSGALRAFHRDESGKEATIMFAVADWWITDMPSFVQQTPALIDIEAIAPSSMLQLSKADMDNLLVRVPKFERFFRILMQNAYIREQLRVLQNLSLPAEVRYANLLQKYPQLSQQVTQKHIASYLGITPEFLSAMRSKRPNS